MGIMRFEGLLITGEPLKEVHAEAVKLFAGLVSPLNGKATNGYESFAIFPCGSKYGWSRYIEHQERIAKFVKIIRTTNHRWVVVRYGDELGDSTILDFQ